LRTSGQGLLSAFLLFFSAPPPGKVARRLGKTRDWPIYSASSAAAAAAASVMAYLLVMAKSKAYAKKY